MSSIKGSLSIALMLDPVRYPLHREEEEIEGILDRLTQNSKFECYLTVFEQFGFDLRNQEILLTQIYPLENDLDAEKATGKPIRLVRIKVVVKAVRLLSGELVKEKS